MTERNRINESNRITKRIFRRDNQSLRYPRIARWLLVLLLLVLVVGPTQGQTDPTANSSEPTASGRTLTLTEIQLTGATRTTLATVSRYLPLVPGQAIDQTAMVDAVAELRAGGLFNTVSFYTRPGAERGQLILVLEVTEHKLDFRWAAGNTDLEGWYLVPAMVAYDNAFGRGGTLDAQWRIGFRHSGSLVRYGQNHAGDDGSRFWSMQLAAVSTDRPYFSDGVEFRHEVRTAGIAAILGRQRTAFRRGEIGLKFEGVHVADYSVANSKSRDESIDYEQEIPEIDLPTAIQNGIGKELRAIAHMDWQFDSRSSLYRAGTPVSGAWGRLRTRYTIQENHHSHAGLQADLRKYHEAPGGVLAFRVRAAWVGKQAAFYDRQYLGGMYSVRGFPTHSLSAPGGDTWLWSSSLEYRSRILGSGNKTKLAGVFFVDAGASGASDVADPYTGVAASAGYGVRMRVWWLDWVGIDVGFPLTERPLEMRFQTTASIGWSF